MKQWLSMCFLLGGISLAASSQVPKVDQYGQFAGEAWPNKVTTDSELREDLKNEESELAQINYDRFDDFGGVKGVMNLKATGFFRLQKIDGRYWLITPQGNPFYLKGVDAVPYNERGNFTQVYDSAGQMRDVFAKGVPDKKDFPEAWSKDGKNVSFLVANIKRKYGENFHSRWLALTWKRLYAWGFNASAKWNNPFIPERIPFIGDGGLSIKDPYHPDFAVKAEEELKTRCTRFKDNPYMIGYQISNEDGWSRRDIYKFLQDTSGQSGAKRALLKQLSETSQGDPGKYFKRSGVPLEQLMKEALNGEQIPSAELDTFLLASARLYYSKLAEIIRRHDPNHLFLGASLCVYQDVFWIQGAAEIVDIVPLHCYDLNNAWVENFALPVLRKLDKPFAQLEFAFTTTKRGFPPFGDRRTVVASHADRGRAFQMLTEHLAADPLCVGTAYFVLHDQPLTVRAHHWENYNFGLVDVVDRPYDDMLKYVKKANERLFDIHAGKISPIPTEQLTLVNKKYSDLMPYSLHPFHGYDKTEPRNFEGDIDRLHIYPPKEYRRDVVGKFLPLGTIDAGRKGGFKKVEVYTYLWKKGWPTKPQQWFQLEESADNRHFTPVPTDFKLVRDHERFPEYLMTPKRLNSNTRYVRIRMAFHDPDNLWIGELSRVHVERH